MNTDIGVQAIDGKYEFSWNFVTLIENQEELPEGFEAVSIGNYRISFSTANVNFQEISFY